MSFFISNQGRDFVSFWVQRKSAVLQTQLFHTGGFLPWPRWLCVSCFGVSHTCFHHPKPASSHMCGPWASYMCVSVFIYKKNIWESVGEGTLKAFCKSLDASGCRWMQAQPKYQTFCSLIYSHEAEFVLTTPWRVSVFALHTENAAKVVHLNKSKHKGLDKACNRTEGKNNLCRSYQIKSDIKCKHLLEQTKARQFSWEGERLNLDSFRNYLGEAERRILPAIPTTFGI